MKTPFIAAVLMLIAAAIFGIVGFTSAPKNNTYVALGIVFAILAASAFRRSRTR